MLNKQLFIVSHLLRTALVLTICAVLMNVQRLSAQNNPATPAPVATAPATGGATIHVVQRGENLFRIAIRYGTTVDAIVAANGLGDPTQIQVGQRLLIPGGTAPIPDDASADSGD